VATTRPKPPASADVLYVESSALVAAMLEGDPDAHDSLQRPRRRVASRLTIAETARAIGRARAMGRLAAEEERAALIWLQEFENQCDLSDVTVDVLTRAGRPFPVEPIRMLDAIHLATVELLGETPQLLTIVTRDRRVRDNAMSIGYAVE
jgi:predicted nucleic acid-binding protein